MNHKDEKLVALAVEVFQKITLLYKFSKTLLYEEIFFLCNIPNSESKIFNKMAFDLKVACGLVPVMNGVKATTKRLIDSVEMYGNMIGDSGKFALITFVIKSRHLQYHCRFSE